LHDLGNFTPMKTAEPKAMQSAERFPTDLATSEAEAGLTIVLPASVAVGRARFERRKAFHDRQLVSKEIPEREALWKQ
jgi:hypothetical protein